MRISWSSGSPLLRRGLLAVLREIFARDPESTQRRRISAIDGRVQQNLADLPLRHAVADGAVEMEFQFLGLAQRDQHRDIQHASDPARRSEEHTSELQSQSNL